MSHRHEPVELLLSAMETWPQGVLITAAAGARGGVGRIVFANRAFERMSGYTRDELIDRPRRILDGPRTDRRKLKRLSVQDPGNAPAPVVVTQYRKGGAPLTVEVTAFPLPSAHRVYVYREASEDSFIEQEVHRLRDALATDARKATEEESAFAAMLRVICGMRGAPYGEAWVPRRDGQVLRLAATWRSSSGPSAGFVAARRTISVRSGEGAVGRAWSSKRPERIDDAPGATSEDPVRSGDPRAAGLEAGAAMPLLAGERVYAVLAFFVDRPHPRDDVVFRVAAEAVAPLGLLLEDRVVRTQLIAAARQQAAVARLTRHVLEDTTDESLFERAVQLTAKALGVDCCGLFRVCADRDSIALVAGIGLGAPGTTLRLARGLRRQLFAEPQVLARPDEQGQDATPFALAASCRTLLTVPVRGYRSTRKILAVFAPASDAFDRSDRHFVEAIASVLTTRLYRRHAASSDARLAQIFETAAEPILTVDGRGLIESVNRAAVEKLGWPADRLLGLHARSVIPSLFGRMPDPGPDTCRRSIGPLIGAQTEVLCSRRDGTTFPAELSVSSMEADGRPIYTLFMRDISKRRAVEVELERHREHLESLVDERTAQLDATLERVRASERMASIGTLAAGLGHDIKNLLFPIHCRLDSVDAVIRSRRARHDLDCVRESLHYLKKLSDGLRMLVKDPGQEPAEASSTDLESWWDSVEPLLSKVLPANVRLETRFAPGLRPAAVAPHALTQAVLNLVVNASEAAPRGNCIELRAEPRGGDRLIDLTVTDDGCGMTPEVQRHAFDPFFTTKKRGISTGLGLSLVRAVAEAARGSVEIESRPGRGTAVRLTLPAVASADEGPARPLRWVADVSIDDERMAGAAAVVLESEGFLVRRRPGPAPDSVLWVTDEAPAAGKPRDGGGPPPQHVLLIGREGDPAAGGTCGRITPVDRAGGIAALRAAARRVASGLRRASTP